MNTNLTRLHPPGDFAAQIEAKRAEIEGEADTAGRGFSKSLADLVHLQNAEILRLNRVIRDNTVIPERHPVEVAVGSVADQNGYLKHVLFAVASDRSMFLLENFSSRGRPEHFKWARVPNLPQAADEADAGQ